MFSLSLFVSLRGDTPDTYIYKRIFDNVQNYSFIPSVFYLQTGVEIGYGYLAYLTSLFSSSHIPLFFIISFLTFYSLYKSARLISVSYIYILLCYLPTFFIPHQLLQIRQGLSAAIVYLAIIYFIDSKRLKPFILWIIAISFHTISWSISWVFLIPQKLINKLKIYSNKHPIVYFLIIILISIIAARLLLQILPDINDRIGGYSESEQYASNRSFLHPANLRIYLLFTFFLSHNKYLKDNKIYFVFLTLYSMGLGFRVGFYDFLILSGRLGSYFTYSEIFLVPIVVSVYKGKMVRNTILLMYFLISLYIGLSFQYSDIIESYFMPLT